MGQVLRVRTAAPPTRGKANQAVADILARTLEVPRTDVRVARGHASRDKIIEVVGLDRAELLRRMEKALPPTLAASATP